MQEIHGNTLGLKQSQLHALRRTYRRRVDAGEVVSPELARHLTEISRETNRQVGVLLDRKGDVAWVLVGDAGKLTLPDIGRARAGSPTCAASRSPATTTPTSRSCGSTR
jgi:GTP-binding protein HflX